MQLIAAGMLVTVCWLAPSQTSNCKQQNADAQVSILLAAFPVHLRTVWQQQVFCIAGGEHQLWLAGHLDSSQPYRDNQQQLPNRKRQGSCSHPCAVSVTEANWTGTAVHVSVMHIYAWDRFTYTTGGNSVPGFFGQTAIPARTEYCDTNIP